MKVLITGARGQLGRELLHTCPGGCLATGIDLPEVDITDPVQVDQMVAALRPDRVINCAAYTNVDRAESDEEAAYAVNCSGPANLARAAQKHSAGLVHISTDFVFNGNQCRAYKPDDRPDPKSVYGRTKLAGEQAVLDILGKDVLIIRTSWLYAGQGSNFVNTMIRLMKENEALTVVDDQIGTPCWAKGLAKVLWTAVEKDLKGVFHWSDAGVASWYDFAVAIQEEAMDAGLLNRFIPVKPVSTDQYPTPAQRPAFSVLNKNDLEAATGIHVQHWRRQLRCMIKELK